MIKLSSYPIKLSSDPELQPDAIGAELDKALNTVIDNVFDKLMADLDKIHSKRGRRRP